MKLTIIIPCYNEINTILLVVEAVKAAPYSDKEIIIVDDCSNDGTRQILKETISKHVEKIIYHTTNQGKGASLRSGIKEATGDIIVIQDADLEYDPSEYPLLIEPILRDQADVVFGSRFLSGRPHRVLYFWHRLGNGLLTFFSNMLTILS